MAMDYLDPGDATTPEQQAALSAALRRQQTLGLIAQLSGDKVLAPVGNSLIESADRGQQRADVAKNRRLQLTLENKKDQELQQYRKDEMDFRNRSEADREKDRALTRGALNLQRQAQMDAKAERDAAARGAKDDAFKQKVWAPFAEEFDTAKGRANLNAKNESQIRRAEDLETLLKSPTADTAQKYSEAVAMAAFIANGGNAPSVEQIHEMSQKTLGMDLAKAKSYLTGNPEDAHARALMEQMLQQSERIKIIGQAQIKRSFLEKLSKHPEVLRRYPEDAKRHLENLGITEDMYDPTTLKAAYDPVKEAQVETTLGPDDAKALEWARTNRDNPKSKNILQHLGLRK